MVSAVSIVCGLYMEIKIQNIFIVGPRNGLGGIILMGSRTQHGSGARIQGG